MAEIQGVTSLGRIVPAELIPAYASELLGRDDIDFVDVRSARNNCFHVRIVRAEQGPFYFNNEADR